MCGITGYFLSTPGGDSKLLRAMTGSLAHRGPDDEGYFLYDFREKTASHFSGCDTHDFWKHQYASLPPVAAHQLALGHRRYAVIDTGPQGHQPFERDGIVAVFNGEIYNYLELRAELMQAGQTFSTQTDTEVLLAAYRHWGKACFSRFNGPFALALFNRQTQELLLARDPVGKAPLYWYGDNNQFFFSSDIKPLLIARPEGRRQINPEAVSHYLLAGLRDWQHQTFWQGIQSLPAGSWMLVQQEASGRLRYQSTTFWQLPARRLSSREISLAEATDQFRSLFKRAVEFRLRSDLQVGFTLSGGLDSSAIVAQAASQYPESYFPCYTVSFDDPVHNEEPFARKVAQAFPRQLDYQVLKGSAYTLADELDSFFFLQEEPFHNPNLFTDHQLQRQLKASGIGVNINGAGGDELLAGYETEYYPLFLRRQWRQGLGAFLPESLSGLLYHPRLRSKLGSLRQVWYALRRSSAEWSGPDARRFLAGNFAGFQPPQPASSFEERMIDNFTHFKMNYWMRSGTKHYFGIPVEPRNPFLDKDLVDFCFHLPPEYLIHRRWHKYLLRKAMEPLLPNEIVWRRYKMGFPFPLENWLAKHESLFKSLLQQTEIPFLQLPLVLQEYEQLNRKNSDLLWRLLCFGLWYRKMIDQEPLNIVPQ